MRTAIVLVFLAMISSGCGGYHYTAYDGPTLPPSERATIDTDSWRDVQIVSVDGKKALNLPVFLIVGRWPTVVYVRPGHHEIVPIFHTPYLELSNGALEIEAQAGHTYTVKYRLEDTEGVIFWIVDHKPKEQTAQ